MGAESASRANCPFFDARHDRIEAVSLGFFRCRDLICRINGSYGRQASVDLNHSTFANGRRRRRGTRDGRTVADTELRLAGLWGRSTSFSRVEIVSSRLSRRAFRWATIGLGGAWKMRARRLGARSSSSSMLVSILQTSFRSSATSAVNCVIVRETGFDGSNWDMGFIDCLSLVRPPLAWPRLSNRHAIPGARSPRSKQRTPLAAYNNKREFADSHKGETDFAKPGHKKRSVLMGEPISAPRR
jgi:hypothetical protein